MWTNYRTCTLAGLAGRRQPRATAGHGPRRHAARSGAQTGATEMSNSYISLTIKLFNILEWREKFFKICQYGLKLFVYLQKRNVRMAKLVVDPALGRLHEAAKLLSLGRRCVYQAQSPLFIYWLITYCYFFITPYLVGWWNFSDGSNFSMESQLQWRSLIIMLGL